MLTLENALEYRTLPSDGATKNVTFRLRNVVRTEPAGGDRVGNQKLAHSIGLLVIVIPKLRMHLSEV